MIALTKRKKTETFFRSSLYLIIIALATLAAWITKIPYIAVGVYSLAMLIMAFFDKEMTGLIPIVLCSAFIFGDNSMLNTTQMTFIIGILIFVLFVSALIYYGKQKLVFVINRGIISFIIVSLVTMAGGISNAHILTKGWFLGLQIFMGAGILYFLLCNVIKTNWKLYFTRALVVTSVIVILQFWLSLILEGSFFTSLSSGSFAVGWGSGSGVAMSLLLLSPFSLYLAIRSRKPLIYTAIYFLNFATIIATQESLAIIIMFAFTIFLSRYVAKKGRRPKIILSELAVLFVLMVGAIAVLPPLRPVLGGVFRVGFSEIFINWEIALTEFINGNIITGNGFVFNAMLEGSGENVLWYKSNLLQIANNLGLLGLAGFSIFTILKFKLLNATLTIYSRMTVFAMLMASIYALVSPDFFKAYFFLPLVVLMVIAYNETVIHTRGEYGIKRYRLRIDNFRFVFGRSNKRIARIKVANPNYKYYELKLGTKGIFLK